MPQSQIIITADYREKTSGIPDRLIEEGAIVNFLNLKAGDYIINNEIIIERKSAEDFVQSVISGRLFTQCVLLKKMFMNPLLILEGDPYNTLHKIDTRAIKGALLSIVASWQIPIVYSDNTMDSAAAILMLSKQKLQQVSLMNYNCYKPKKIKSHRLKFLQGLPKTGPVIADRLLDKFGSIQAVVNADVKALMEVDGIGKVMAEKIRTFITGN